MQWHREAYIDLMTFVRTDRQMLVELFGTLIGLDPEWMEQGATGDEINLTAFDFDFVPTISCGGNTGLRGGVTPRVIQETDTHVFEVDAYGRKTRLCKGSATIPLPMDYPVKDEESWQKVKPWFQFHEDRICWEQVDRARELQKAGALVMADIPGGFDLPRQLMGEEGVCYSYYDQPDLIRDILETAGNTAYQVLDRISDRLTIDNLSVHEDMAGKSGPLIGPNLVEAFIRPYYRKVWDMLESKGTRLFSQDSDGNMTMVVEAFIDCGINIMFPAEPAAGMDMVALRKKYGRKLAFKGGIDKHVLRQDRAAIRKELEYKLQPLMQQGGTVFGLDHRIPNGTPLENYRYYVKTARELLNLPPIKDKGWSRMAF